MYEQVYVLPHPSGYVIVIVFFSEVPLSVNVGIGIVSVYSLVLVILVFPIPFVTLTPTVYLVSASKPVKV